MPKTKEGYNYETELSSSLPLGHNLYKLKELIEAFLKACLCVKDEWKPQVEAVTVFQSLSRHKLACEKKHREWSNGLLSTSNDRQGISGYMWPTNRMTVLPFLPQRKTAERQHQYNVFVSFSFSFCLFHFVFASVSQCSLCCLETVFSRLDPEKLKRQNLAQ